ncbi:hypothetical protein MGG_01729 [Pyricularia oryzae 70-15]|uniref:Uncharacterized protein n=4 Tax=Pyricularia oryzae TaxID=318829 RepID=G4MV98_PYRO7|nr:uncharacterized protein MGG_01729 [Pyricularia oryzae 70-15]EHA54920.1 hypothetical protein MGG_01729 [Pyricularia oryzae 70-15]KAI7912963.1 hypothetical protein M9X92_009739 [Pyricularia oryzae]KAI7914466.1 hypothetical protein M0657_009470 [Pyricularia oryzae]
MAPQYSDAPEPISASYPEVVPTPQHQAHTWQAPSQHQPGYINDGSTPVTSKPGQPWSSPQTSYNGAQGSDRGYDSHNGTYAGSTMVFNPEKTHMELPAAEKIKKKTLCGCSVIVFILSVIIAVLIGAVVGLASGTGIQTARFNEANDKLQSLEASMASKSFPTGTGNAPAATTTAVIDNGCSSNPTAVNGKDYTAFELLGSTIFTMRCGKDVNAPVLMSLFVPDFNSCMDSCSSWTTYAPRMFGSNDNTTCTGVSFIPLWTNKTIALKGGAPGNCYLKKNASTGSFQTGNAGTPVHGAVVTLL